MNRISKLHGATFVVKPYAGHTVKHVSEVGDIVLCVITPSGDVIPVRPTADANLDAFVAQLSSFADRLPASGLFRVFVSFVVDGQYYASPYVDAFELDAVAQYARVEFQGIASRVKSAYAARFFRRAGSVRIDTAGRLYDIDAHTGTVIQSEDNITYANVEGVVTFRSNDEVMSDIFSALAAGGGGGGAKSNYGLPRRIVHPEQYVFEGWWDTVDYKAAEAAMNNVSALAKVAACSSALIGGEYLRLLDWTYDYHAECVVHLPAGAGRYASDAICGNLTGFDVRDGYDIPEDLWKIIPCRVLDGRNEAGLVINVNVVPIEPGTDFDHTEPLSGVAMTELNALMIPRFVLDNFASAQAAAAYLAQYCRINIPSALRAMGYNAHYMIVDNSRRPLVVEFINGQVTITESSQMTNFEVTNIQPNADGSVYTPADVAEDPTHTPSTVNGIQLHGSGLERWNLIVSMRESGATAEEIVDALLYTHAYDPHTDPYWFTEFTGADILGDNLTVDNPSGDFAKIVAAAQQAYIDRSRETGKTWHSTHAVIYDLETGAMSVRFQENGKFVTFSAQPSVDDTLVFSAEEMPGDDSSVVIVDADVVGNTRRLMSGSARRVKITIDNKASAILPIIASVGGEGHATYKIAGGVVNEMSAVVMILFDPTTGQFIKGECRATEIVTTEDQDFDEEQQMTVRRNLGLYRTDVDSSTMSIAYKGDIEGRQTVVTDTGDTYAKVDDIPADLTLEILQTSSQLDGVDLSPATVLTDDRNNIRIAPDGGLATLILRPVGNDNPVQYDGEGHTVSLPDTGIWARVAFVLDYTITSSTVVQVEPEYIPE